MTDPLFVFLMNDLVESMKFSAGLNVAFVFKFMILFFIFFATIFPIGVYNTPDALAFIKHHSLGPSRHVLSPHSMHSHWKPDKHTAGKSLMANVFGNDLNSFIIIR